MLRHVELLACLKILDPGRQKYFNQKVPSDIPGELLVNVQCMQKYFNQKVPSDIPGELLVNVQCMQKLV